MIRSFHLTKVIAASELRFPRLARIALVAACGFALCCVALLHSSGVAFAQGGNSLEIPQTRLAPIGPAPGQGLSLGTQGLGGQSFGPQGFAGGALPSNPPFAASGGPSFAAPFPGSNGPAAGSLFDPYSGGPAAGYVAPSQPSSGGFFGGPVTIAPQGGLFGTPAYGGGAAQAPPVFGGGNLFGGSPTAIPSTGFGGPAFTSPGAFGAPTGYGYPAAAYPNGAPSTLFPGGLIGNTSSFNPQFNPYRLIQRARFRHAFLHGDDSPDALEINDTDVAFAFALPRFFASTQPLFLTPSFSFHQWDGPEAGTGADLPSNAYSAFLDFGWISDPNQIVGAELGVNVGSYSEFSIFRSDSLRVRGKGLGTFRLTPATTFKLGVYYYDRVRIKLLPAGGLLWRPNPFTKVDLFFPQPKVSRFISTVGVNDVWWYLAGDYGGGSWTIDRDDGRSDQVDINDIRLMMGFEWGTSEQMRAGTRTAFFEFGYVADRELVYRHNPQDDLGLDDTWMVRLGLGY